MRHRRLLKLKHVMEITSKSKSSIYSDIKDGKFPAAVKIGERAVAWDSEAVENWIAEKISAGAAA